MARPDVRPSGTCDGKTCYVGNSERISIYGNRNPAAKLGKSGECYVGVVIPDKYLTNMRKLLLAVYHEGYRKKALQKDCLTTLEILTADAERKCEVPKNIKGKQSAGDCHNWTA